MERLRRVLYSNWTFFYWTKILFKIDDIDVNKILISKKELFSKKKLFKYYIGGYDDHDYLGPLWIKLPQMTGYVKHFDSNKTVSFKVIDNKLLKNYLKIW